ncbi:AIPR family protein [Photobacterium phosphoreum]|uniref:AIPR family protein n=1 Tax=Photobacterium phosphoreum TaxID=659 RepID=UPI001E3FA921|nr:AIPR family protein [Photobacterium phosphoreum]MCD9506563.1 AIPR protein [Photobacterium phosphoreum]
MDRITKQLLADFINIQEIKITKESENFEDFCNYTIISNEYNKTFDISSITVGAGADTGIDGIAIIVNGHLVEEIDEVSDLLTSNGYLDVTYIFTQVKTSSNFETKDMNTFYFGVNDFFATEPKLPRNNDIKKFADISDFILNKASDFKDNPKCKTFYITTGVVKDDDNINAVVNTSKDTLNSLNLFETIEHSIIGANELGKLYRKTKSPVSSTFIFSDKVALPQIDGVDQAYHGYIPFTEFKKIILDENENILSVFDDNVRDFQGINNVVNSSIAETLCCNNPMMFSVLNNGITIVANTIKTAGNTFTIYDYQIVNGCQTANVLYENRNAKNIDNVSIPLRLIVTCDDDIKSQVTISTNNQTPIKKEQLSAMSDFQKNLEHYYNSITGDGRLYYERRAKQYNSDRNVIKRRIITVSNLVKSFSSMFDQNPHLVTSYFGLLVKNMGDETKSKIFNTDHQYAPYYLAGLVYYKLDGLFNAGEIDKKYRKVKFYLIMLVPLLASDEKFPPLNSQNKVEKYCDTIIKILNNDSKCKRLFKSAVKVIDDSKVDLEDKQALKVKLSTNQVLEQFEKLGTNKTFRLRRSPRNTTAPTV